MRQPKLGADYSASTITNNPLNVVDKFTYLGSTLSQNALLNDEMSARFVKLGVEELRGHDFTVVGRNRLDVRKYSLS